MDFSPENANRKPRHCFKMAGFYANHKAGTRSESNVLLLRFLHPEKNDFYGIL